MDALLLTLERMAEPLSRKIGALISTSLVLLLAGLLLLESQFRALAFIAVVVGIWVAGVTFFGKMFSRIQGAVSSTNQPSSVIANAPFKFQVLMMAFSVMWLFGLAAMSCILLLKIAS